MNYLKFTFLSCATVIVFCLTTFAQIKEEEKKIPKPNPPVVIVNPEKKNDEKHRKDEKQGSKPPSILFD